MEQCGAVSNAPSLGARALRATIRRAVRRSILRSPTNGSISSSGAESIARSFVSQLALSSRFLDVFGGSQGKRHDCQGRVLLARRGEGAAVGDEEVLHVVRLAVAVQHGAAPVLAHSHRADLVAGETSRLRAVLQEYLAFDARADVRHALARVLP